MFISGKEITLFEGWTKIVFTDTTNSIDDVTWKCEFLVHCSLVGIFELADKFHRETAFFTFRNNNKNISLLFLPIFYCVQNSYFKHTKSFSLPVVSVSAICTICAHENFKVERTNAIYFYRFFIYHSQEVTQSGSLTLTNNQFRFFALASAWQWRNMQRW